MNALPELVEDKPMTLGSTSARSRTLRAANSAESANLAALNERLPLLEEQYAEALRQAEAHYQRTAEIYSIGDEEIADLKRRLIAEAETAWARWTHVEHCAAVQDYMLIEASLLRRAIAGEIAAGRDPYGPGGALQPEYEECGPHLPEPERGILERGARHWRMYQGPSVLRLSADISEVKSAIERATQADTNTVLAEAA